MNFIWLPREVICQFSKLELWISKGLMEWQLFGCSFLTTTTWKRKQLFKKTEYTWHYDLTFESLRVNRKHCFSAIYVLCSIPLATKQLSTHRHTYHTHILTFSHTPKTCKHLEENKYNAFIHDRLGLSSQYSETVANRC